mmetsp:Transcript_33944/g.71385  ORF Transcript_33944/g.71385 Transcript_33944/m.71385 type:complete len:84 (+) Transcript_33944:2025-2276(+)
MGKSVCKTANASRFNGSTSINRFIPTAEHSKKKNPPLGWHLFLEWKKGTPSGRGLWLKWQYFEMRLHPLLRSNSSGRRENWLG